MEKSRLIQIAFHTSDGLNYCLFGLLLLCSIMPLFLNGMDGITYTNFQVGIFIILILTMAFLAKQITNHKVYAVYILAIILIIICIIRPGYIYFVVPYLLITATPYILAFQEVRNANT